jgi:methyl-accepting chemotaxis protein
MRSINANTVDIATNWLASIRVLGDLQANVIMNRNILREHLLAESLEDKLKVEKAIAANVESIAKSRQAYEPLITSAPSAPPDCGNRTEGIVSSVIFRRRHLG